MLLIQTRERVDVSPARFVDRRLVHSPLCKPVKVMDILSNLPWNVFQAMFAQKTNSHRRLSSALSIEQLVNPSRLHFWSMFSLIAPPAFSGTLLGLVPIIIMTLAVYVLLYGPPYIDTTDWVLDSYKLHYMDAAVDPDNYAKARLIKKHGGPI